MEDTNSESGSHGRRTVLKSAVGLGALMGGLGAATGSAAAQQGGGGFKKLSFDVTKSGTIIEEVDAVDNSDFSVNDDATFDGKLVLTDLDVNEDDELVASGRLKGTLSSNPTQQINETFQNLVLGLLEDILNILSPDSPGECPILELDVGAIFLDLLGLQISISEIAIDIIAVAGEGNLLGNLLCAVASLLDP